MQRFPFQSWLNYNPLLPASDKWSTPLNSPHHDDLKKVWFVGCLTTARATPASREGGSQDKPSQLKQRLIPQEFEE